MTPENASAMEPQPASMGQFSRIIGIFFEPKKAFADIAQRPSWIVPMVLTVLCVMAVTTTMAQHIGWERMFRQQAQTSSRLQQQTPEQREQAIALQVKFASVGAYGGALVGVPIYNLVLAAILMGIAGGIMSGGMKFKQVFAVVCYAGLPGIISAALTVVVMFMKSPDEYNFANPLAFNVGAFMDPTTSSKFVYSMASSIDLFSFWIIFLLATGLKATAGKKLTFGGALVAVILPWAIYVLGKSAISGAFS
jgi:hypothetical protein